MRILVADDERESAAALKALLEVIGHEVVGPAADGAEAVALARDEHPDLAILDIDMPGLTGLEAADRISEREPIPVILLTGHTDPALLERALQLPVFTYLVKPAGPDDLIPAIRISRARFDEWSTLHVQLGAATRKLEERKTIERAKGILMDTLRVAEGEAFRLLRTRSQKQGRPMVQVCRAVVAAETVLRRGAVGPAAEAHPQA